MAVNRPVEIAPARIRGEVRTGLRANEIAWYGASVHPSGDPKVNVEAARILRAAADVLSPPELLLESGDSLTSETGENR